MTSLHLHRLEPASPATPVDSLVILLHGYGADGRDLIDLGHAWRGALPNAAFVAPDAPAPCEMGGSGFQWWSIADGLDPRLSLPRADALRDMIHNLVETERTRYGVATGRVALAGFSQGGMLALHAGLRLPHTLAGVISYSGLLLDPMLTNATRPTPPVLMAHGAMDTIVPFVFLDAGVTALQQHGVSVERLARPLMGHSIDVECLTAGGAFLAKHLAAPPKAAA
jgi:phospholipase/carboxylesterase